MNSNILYGLVVDTSKGECDLQLYNIYEVVDRSLDIPENYYNIDTLYFVKPFKYENGYYKRRFTLLEDTPLVRLICE